MSSGVFRGKESSNRIELSRLVQDLLNFGVLGSLWLWGWEGGLGGCMGVGGGWEVPPHTCTCMHAHIHVKHDNFNCKWQPPLGESLGIPYDVIHARACVHMHACMCMCMCVECTLSPPPTPIHPPPTPHPPGGTTGISQNSIALEKIEIF